MCRLLESIDAVGDAADTLTRACARQGALVDSAVTDSPFKALLRQQFRSALVTPADMVSALGKLK